MAISFRDDILHDMNTTIARIVGVGKHLSHFYRMNPQALRRPRTTPTISTILTAVGILAVAALFWIGKSHP